MKISLIFSVLALIALTATTSGSTETEAMAYAEGIASSSYWISSKLIGVNITCEQEDGWLQVNGTIESDDDEYLKEVVCDGSELSIKVTERYPSIEACSFTVFRSNGDVLVEVIAYN